jgi:hypothetical protein
MACVDYVTLDELKGMVDVGSKTDESLALLLHGAMDWLDESIFGHSFNRAIRLYYEPDTDGTTAATCAVSAAALTIVITGGPHAGTSTFSFALWTTLGALVDAINGVDIGVTAELLHSKWLADQPCTNLATRSATSILGIENWIVLCLTQLTICLDGGGDPYLFLPLEPQTVNGVVEDGTALVQGTQYYVKRDGYLIRNNVCAVSTSVSCTASTCICPSPGCWSCAKPCNVIVSFVPTAWVAPRAKIGMAIVEFTKNLLASTSMQYEMIGKYAYKAGNLQLLYQLLAPLMNIGVVITPYPGF